jgi:hypothetical protein
MASSILNDFAGNGPTIADKAAERIEIREPQQAAKEAGSTWSNQVDDLRSDAGQAIQRVVGRFTSRSRQGVDAVGNIASQLREVALSSSESIVAYSKKNPASALAIAATSGALLYATIKASRRRATKESRARSSDERNSRVDICHSSLESCSDWSLDSWPVKA